MCRLTGLQRSRIGAQSGGCTSVAVVLPHLPEEGVGLLQVLLQQHGVFVVAVECPRQVPGQRGGLLGSMSLHDQQVTLRFAKVGGKKKDSKKPRSPPQESGVPFLGPLRWVGPMTGSPARL